MVQDKDDERMDTSDAISQLGADWPKRLRCVTQGFSRLGLGPLTEEVRAPFPERLKYW